MIKSIGMGMREGALQCSLSKGSSSKTIDGEVVAVLPETLLENRQKK